MNIKYEKLTDIALVIFIIFLVGIFLFTRKEEDIQEVPESIMNTTFHVPEWLEQEIDTSKKIKEQESGPVITAEGNAYVFFKIMFYDIERDKQITDPEILEELLGMFQYTKDNFIYDKERTENGVCFFYYNGVLSPENSAGIFSGFEGKKNFPEGKSEKIGKIIMRFRVSTVPANSVDNLEEALKKS